MSVSSVKNLNGNEFSAVQDTSLTEFVQTNSASWGQGGGTTLTGDAQGAVNNVYTNSAKYILNNNTSVKIGTNNSANSTGFAFGTYNTAAGWSFAQGAINYAELYSLSQGHYCIAYNHSISQGANNSAVVYSQAFGNHTTANNSGMAIGTYNKTTTGAFVIGNGDSNTYSDCFIIDHNGNVSAAGKISANGVELGSVPYNMVYTASLPATPDANTLYLIPEA